MKDIKTNKTNTHIAYYGNTPIVKTICPNCKRESFVIDGVLACCGIESDLKPEFTKRASVSAQPRTLPSLDSQRKILAKQRNRCIYCDVVFGSKIVRRNKKVTACLVWDHFIPYAYSQNNSDSNFLASCQICNGIKSSQFFDSINEAKSYIMKRRKEKGYENNPMPILRESNRKNKKDEKVLLKFVSDKSQRLEGHPSQNKETSFNGQTSGDISRRKSDDNPKENSKPRNKSGCDIRTDGNLPKQPQEIKKPHEPNLELSNWLKEYISGSAEKRKFVCKITEKSRSAVEAYANGTYFLPKENGGLGVMKSNIEETIEAFKESVENNQTNKNSQPSVSRKPKREIITVNPDCENSFIFTNGKGLVLARICFENGKVTGFRFGEN